MRNTLLMIVIACMAFTCDENEEVELTAGIVGKWKLKEIYADPGNGSGKFNEVESDKTITFLASNEVSTNESLCNLGNNSNGSSTGIYSLQDSTITPTDCDYGDFKIHFVVESSYLILYYPCIEGCGEKYEKVSN
ncbi:lipocalin family protein [Chondrinema litorale]|uniref:lipocalin family protein n=1 Tax=Chondrinema litorale TaxID=2994555 RepID=UPI002543A943|nr:lipocalin family protein [Chondrinema litorale]UZR98149.1 lipocalin family protein [Chondrinema litorale]